MNTHEKLLLRLKKEGDCLVWTGAKHNFGYGMFSFDGKMTLAHRYFYTYYKGEIPEGLFVLHSCDNPPCVLPSHLRVGTNADNLREMAEKNRAGQKNDNYCRAGHKRTEENTSTNRPRRTCKECKNINSREYYHKNKQLNKTTK